MKQLKVYMYKAGGSARGMRRGGVWRMLPVWLPLAVVMFGTVAMVWLILGWFVSWAVWSTGLLAAGAAAWYVCSRTSAVRGLPGGARERALFDWLVLVGAVCWVAISLPFTYQHLRTDRDPATYNVTAAWLTTHTNLHIATPSTYQKLALPGLQADSLGFWVSTLHPNQLAAQGEHMLPALLGLWGRSVGVRLMLHLNVLIGAVALLAMYGFGRTIMRPGWAALGTVLMALSLPMVYFSRDAYTEPLSMLSIFVGLSLLYYACRTGKWGLWLLAGLSMGAATLIRIDGFLPIMGAEAWATVLLAGAKPRLRRRTAIHVGIYVLGMALMGLLAWLDTTRLSSAYYQGQRTQILEEMWGIAAIGAAGAIWIPLNWRFGLIGRLDAATRSWRERALWIMIPLIFLVLLSRPLWYVGYAADHARTFSEQTINWLWWYLGVFGLVAGVAGLTLAIIRVMRRREYALMSLLLVMSTSATLYILHPSITGDQPWASRRFVPVVLPALALLALLFCEWWAEQRRWRLWGFTIRPQAAATALAALVVVGPVFITYPFTFRRLYVPQLSQVEAVCKQAQPASAVLWLGDTGQFMTQPVRAVCGKDAFGVDPNIDTPQATQLLLQAIASRASQQHMQLVVGLFATQKGVIPVSQRQQLTDVSTIVYPDIEHSYLRAPRNAFLTTQTVLMARLLPDGSLALL